MNSSSNPTNSGLDQLHDIVMPAAINQWPIAPGWWVLLLIIVVVSLFFIKTTQQFLLRRKKQKHWHASAQQQLSSIKNMKNDQLFQQAALIYIQQLIKQISGLSDVLVPKNVKTGTDLSKQLSQWLCDDDADYLAIRRYQANNTGVNREQYLRIIQSLVDQLDEVSYVGS